MTTAALLLAVAQPAAAHQGPPFPILMDVPAGPHVVSVWTDPDIGDAYFYVIVETSDGRPAGEGLKVSLWTEPVSGRLPRKDHECQRREMRRRVQYEARPYFDQSDIWNVGFRIETPDGGVRELTSQVESTPPGFGVWDLAIYSLPFAFLGGFWVMALVKRRRLAAHGS